MKYLSIYLCRSTYRKACCLWKLTSLYERRDSLCSKLFRQLVSVTHSPLVLGTGTRVPVSIPVTRVPGRYPGTRVSLNTRVIFFHKVRDTLFLSDNLNTTARAVDACIAPVSQSGTSRMGSIYRPGVAACASHE